MSEQAEMEVAEDLVDSASISDGRAVVSFNRTEAALADLRERYRGVQFDLSTTKGDTAARQARKELVSLRTGLDKRRKDLKAPAIDFSRKIDSEAALLTAEIVALEDPIDAQIKADEQRREEERQARIRAEEQRLAGLRQRIADIEGVALRAVGLFSTEIAEKIALVTRLQIDDTFEEFVAAAINAKAETLLKLQELHAAAVRAEEQAVENERQRQRLAELEAENAARLEREAAERRKAEAEAAAARAAEERAARKRQEQSDAARELADEIRMIQRRGLTSSSAGMLELVMLVEAISIDDQLGDFSGIAQKAKDEALEHLHELHGQKVQAELEAKRQREELEAARRESQRLAALAEEQRARIAVMDKQYADPGVDAPQDEPVVTEDRPPEPATVSTGEIGKRLGFGLRQDFIEQTLGVVHAATDKRATLWRESQWQQIKAALVKHINGPE